MGSSSAATNDTGRASDASTLSIEEDVIPANGEQVAVQLDVVGMTCAACVRRVETALARVAGVVDASVNLPLGRATVTIDPDVASGPALVAAIEGAGYSVPSETAGPTVGGVGTASHAEHRERIDEGSAAPWYATWRSQRPRPSRCSCWAWRTARSRERTEPPGEQCSSCSRASSCSARACASSGSPGARSRTGRAT
jgi:copper chaperone CopZ